jgi:hypothetical protein
MWSLLLSGASSFVSTYINYIKIGLIVLALCLSSYVGFHMGNSRYLEYKAQVETVAEVQKAKVESIQKQQDLVTKGIKNEFEAKLSAIRNYYGGVQYSSSRTMPGISAAPKGTDAETAYPILAGQCAVTTAQLTSLQDWINEQMGLK